MLKDKNLTECDRSKLVKNLKEAKEKPKPVKLNERPITKGERLH